jgi:UDP-N-acetylmuramyl pentapeptide phosphotransferase/UDP-N-acetylglucosamine-1-phosphate transferase
MDGLDWMTVAEVVPVSAALIIFGALGALPWVGVTVAAALLGAMIGFGPFNRPIARLFLGDVGSLPIGLILAFLLIRLAAAGHPAAAVLLPGYYLADATLTLVRRLMDGERVWEAHRSHFYQRATDGGFTVMEIVSRVFAVNVGLALLALATVIWPAQELTVAALGVGGVLVVGLLVVFARGRT